MPFIYISRHECIYPCFMPMSVQFVCLFVILLLVIFVVIVLSLIPRDERADVVEHVRAERPVFHRLRDERQLVGRDSQQGTDRAVGNGHQESAEDHVGAEFGDARWNLHARPAKDQREDGRQKAREEQGDVQKDGLLHVETDEAVQSWISGEDVEHEETDEARERNRPVQRVQQRERDHERVVLVLHHEESAELQTVHQREEVRQHGEDLVLPARGLVVDELQLGLRQHGLLCGELRLLGGIQRLLLLLARQGFQLVAELVHADKLVQLQCAVAGHVKILHQFAHALLWQFRLEDLFQSGLQLVERHLAVLVGVKLLERILGGLGEFLGAVCLQRRGFGTQLGGHGL
mmetsp:Transcript_27052/g.76106  ORF Transcript_27052/g.76106 Transcript_27052/m.76106 type:complete len:347 (-) Transcript_27052:499-1539(-)